MHLPTLHRLLAHTPQHLSVLSSILGGTTTMNQPPPTIRSYLPKHPDGKFPYTARDMQPMDAGNDAQFYLPPRFVTHIDDNAIANLKQYYHAHLPRKGTILDFCSSWVSHYPPDIFNAAKAGELTVLGTGMNEDELRRNPVLAAHMVQDLNADPEVQLPRQRGVELDASTCVVSIDYLTRPVEVLRSVREQTVEGGKVHLAVSNRCFPTKVVGRWLKIGEEERLEMVGDYLYWAGWREIEIVEVVKATFMKDPLWVVRATKRD
jgi:hypothetical protein